MRTVRVLAAAMLAVTLIAVSCSDDDATTSPPAAVTSTTADPPPLTSAAPGPTSPTSTAAVPGPTTSPVTTTTTTVVPSGPARRISKGTNGRPVVALTFDAGSDVGFTDDILDRLRQAGIRASFGITGRWAERYPDQFRRIVDEGHHLVNHTYDHSSMTGRSTGKLPLSRAARAEQVRKAEEVFLRLGGTVSKPWFRPPYGDIDNDLDKLLGDEGYAYNALWSVDSLGWQGLSAAQIAARCKPGLVPGAILLFHVGSQSQDAAALPAILADIRAAGLQPGSLLDVV
jgi:peptidoglycan-N-acetylglucosamine deacetylase